ncbi:MAG: tRNA epoxyqueuosine(34) reductase QueG [Deltaproteobacteria bacterium]|nr:tRNA epoxyqueuosine(34) reductase QueG [Deltaproteobacteria bacterium]
MQVVSEGKRLGFTTVGITTVDPFQEWGGQLQTWLQREYQGAMAWMGRNADRRIDIAKVLAGARTIITCTLNYYTPHTQTDDPLRGRISRYAWGDDYHDVMLPRLKELLDFLFALDPSAEGLAYVDTGPVMEKPWAARAGLGWQGKHTNLIDPQRGSWFFIGEIITTLSQEFYPSQPPLTKGRSLCGKCTACIDICPTRAIIAPYLLDARRCISYLTIEHPGPIPEDLRPLMGNHIYGCDLCQEVCPWNRFATPTPEQAFQPREGNLNPALIDLMYLTDPEFNHRFQGSPIKRIKRRRLLRNVAVALGNSKNPRAIPALQHALNDPELLIREHAAWALETIAQHGSLALQLVDPRV